MEVYEGGRQRVSRGKSIEREGGEKHEEDKGRGGKCVEGEVEGRVWRERNTRETKEEEGSIWRGKQSG